jgi:hypothetical protein
MMELSGLFVITILTHLPIRFNGLEPDNSLRVIPHCDAIRRSEGLLGRIPWEESHWSSNVIYLQPLDQRNQSCGMSGQACSHETYRYFDR